MKFEKFGNKNSIQSFKGHIAHLEKWNVLRNIIQKWKPNKKIYIR